MAQNSPEQRRTPRTGRFWRILLWGLGGLVVALVLAFFGLRSYGLNFTEPDIAAVWGAGFVEKTVEINGTTINYAEGPDNGPPLLLIHGQLGLWKSYLRVLPELSQYYHVFAVDDHGHGESEHDPAKYTIPAQGADFAAFIEDVIGEPAVISGNSSGGLVCLWIGAHSPENVIGVVLEDPPLFSSEHPEVVNTFGFDAMETAHNFIASGEEDFLGYYILNSDMFALFGEDAQNGIYNYVASYRENRPGEPVAVFFLPLSMRGLMYGLDVYDPYYGDSFYLGTMQEDFDHAENLAALDLPTVLIHANFSWGEDGTLMGAMSGEHADRAMELLPDARLEELDAEHATHISNPDDFIRIMLEFGQELDVLAK